MTPDQRQLERQIRQELPGLLKGLPGDKKQQLLDFLQARPSVGDLAGQIVHQQITTTGPVPPVELLVGYNRELPDGANRLFTLVENQSAHRQEIEKAVVKTQNTVTQRGQLFAFFLVLLLSAIGGFFGYTGHDTVAATIFATTVLGVATVFIVGRRSQKKNLAKKQ